jgi:hypothetical protein
VPEFIFRGSSDSVRKSFDVATIDSSENRSAVLRGVDASPRADLDAGSSIFVPKDLSDDQSSFQLGLEDALGKDSNWLTPNIDVPKTLKIIVQDLGMKHKSSSSDIRGMEPLRDLEDGFISTPEWHSNPPRSPVQNISLAVKTISTRVMGQKINDQKSPVSMSAATIRSDTMDRPSLSLKIPEIVTDKYTTPMSSPRDITSPGVLHGSPYNDKHLYTDSTSSSNDTYFVDKKLVYWEDGKPIDGSGKPGPLPASNPVPSDFPLPPLKLVGRSLKIFGSTNPFRIFLYEQLHKVWIEPLSFFLIILHTVILTVGSIPNVFKDISPKDHDNYVLVTEHWYDPWVNWCLLGIFICYTTICIASIIAYGLWDDSQRNKIIKSGNPADKKEMPFTLSASPVPEGLRKRRVKHTPLVSTFANLMPKNLKSTPALQEAHTLQVTPLFRHAQDRAYLRSSWNRIQFVAVASYWISLLFSIDKFGVKKELFIFRMISALPILHLLNLTSGTSSVLRSLKVAAPLLTNVSIFVGFFW